jgi:hypothetical protein
MRALGPGSVSSLLKVALDVVYFILWIVALAVGLATVTGLVLAPFLPSISTGDNNVVVVNGREYADLSRLIPAAAAGLLAVLGYLVGLIAIVGRLRKIFETLTAGDPFRPENVVRLRFIGVVLTGLMLLGYVVPPLMAVLFPEATGEVDIDPSVNLTSWFAVLVIFVLAEVFREGARLRHEAELTI